MTRTQQRLTKMAETLSQNNPNDPVGTMCTICTLCTIHYPQDSEFVVTTLSDIVGGPANAILVRCVAATLLAL